MPLTELKCRTARPKESPYKLADSGGLALRVRPNGSKSWILRYRYDGKEQNMSLGMYPEVSLAAARIERDKAREIHSRGEDPIIVREITKKKAVLSTQTTFKHVAEEWMETKKSDWDEITITATQGRLDQHIYPAIGHLPIEQIKTPIIVSLLRKLERSGLTDTAYRVASIIFRVYSFARAGGMDVENPAADVKEVLKTNTGGNFAAIQPHEIGNLISDIEDAFKNRKLSLQTYLAIQILMLTWLRTNELITLQWSFVDYDKKLITVPLENMKGGKRKIKTMKANEKRVPHEVPLTKQTVAYLKMLQKITASPKWIFPHERGTDRHMSDSTILRALYKMGYKGKMTGHGFRSLGMGICKEILGFRHEVPDRQLGHKPDNEVDRAYDRAQFLKQRSDMLQKFANYTDTLRPKE